MSYWKKFPKKEPIEKVGKEFNLKEIRAKKSMQK